MKLDKPMLALLWKEWREIAAVMPVGLMWLLLAFLTVRALEIPAKPLPRETVSRYDQELHPQPALSEQETRQARFRRTAIQWLVGLGTAMLLGVAAMVGAGAFAQEREGLTEVYLDSLAASRAQVWLAKLESRAAAVVFIYGCASLPVFVYDLEKPVNWDLFWTSGLLVLVVSAFAMTFLASTLLSNSLEALAAGVLLWLIPLFVLGQLGTNPDQPWKHPLARRSMDVTCLILTTYALGLSSWLYVRRPVQESRRRLAWALLGGLLPVIVVPLAVGWVAVQPERRKIVAEATQCSVALIPSTNGESMLITPLSRGTPMLPVNFIPWPVKQSVAAFRREAKQGWAFRSAIISYPSWSPGGRFVSWVSHSGTPKDTKLTLAILDVDSGVLRYQGLSGVELTLDSLRPEYALLLAAEKTCWSDDGTRVFVTGIGASTADSQPAGSALPRILVAETSGKGKLKTFGPETWPDSAGHWLLEAMAATKDGSDLLLFGHFPTADGRPGHQETALFRLNTESGTVEADKHFSRLKELLQTQSGVKDIWFRWITDPWPVKIRGEQVAPRELVTVGFLKGESAQRELWRLWTPDGPKRVLSFETKALQNRYYDVDLAFLDEDTYVFARSISERILERGGSDYEIVKCSFSTGKETGLGKLPCADNIVLSASPSGKWVFIITGCGVDRKTWLAAADGSIFEDVTDKEVPAALLMSWTADSRLVVGAVEYEIVVEGGKPEFRARTIVHRHEFSGLPDGVHQGMVHVAAETVLVPYSVPAGVCLYRDHRLYRADLRTGRRELVLRLADSDSPWTGSDSFSVKAPKEH